ncbi:DNA cytosine methyltransferase [Paenibacillus apiarius]|uniref:DNA cytosine methyltransferase n=1 Tax=Paenibacillus apiarius TaxID=46240 RepID=UPI00197E0D27|nr:DNA cytosine methyltransferase [Paenibacillus apiarius]MBN3525177.1 DNA cytosine methyltransferase [Paenibacillus apiarius]
MYFIDLFAGAGGLSEGFMRQGYKPIAHIEMDRYAALTLKTRAAYHNLKNNDRLAIYHDYLLKKMSREDLYEQIPKSEADAVINLEISDETIDYLFREIDHRLVSMTGQKSTVDVLIGGPPCQAYSLVGRARDPYGKEKDPRNYLYKQYVKFLDRYKPSIFVFENVPGILNAAKGKLFEDVQSIMRDAGYNITAKTLNAADFGVLQQRKRVILIGWKEELDYEYPEFKKVNHNYIVRDLLEDVPSLQPGTEKNFFYTKEPSNYLSKFDIRGKDDILTQHMARIHNENDRQIYETAIAMWNNHKQRLKYTDLPEINRTHKNLKSFLDRFKVVSEDLPFSHTVVAHIAKDGHYYIHPDISQRRSLSVREAARLQSFPDNFFFEGPRTSVFTQIGNAVPPLMAEQIAKHVGFMLTDKVEKQLSLNL